MLYVYLATVGRGSSTLLGMDKFCPTLPKFFVGYRIKYAVIDNAVEPTGCSEWASGPRKVPGPVSAEMQPLNCGLFLVLNLHAHSVGCGAETRVEPLRV